ncbi:MAG: helix-turn-helix transcriptional regulator [Pseudomonadota bacterium]
MTLEKIISKNIRAIRQQKGLSQKRLAENAGLDVRQISKYENDPDHFSTQTIERLAVGLSIKAHELLYDDDGRVSDNLPKHLEPGLREAVRVLRVQIERIKKP